MWRHDGVARCSRSLRIAALTSVLAVLAFTATTVSVGAQTPGPCDGPNTCTIWSAAQVPDNPAATDTNAVEVGVKFRTAVSGYITAVRFYKSSTNTGAHVVNLWTETGTLLTRATAVNETPSGWQEVPLPSPVAVLPNTTYVASYHTNVGAYAS